MAKQDIKNMHLGEIKKQAQKKGLPDAEHKNKGQLIQEMGTSSAQSSKPGRGGGRAKAPAPKGTKPSEWKNIPGNQS